MFTEISVRSITQYSRYCRYQTRLWYRSLSTLQTIDKTVHRLLQTLSLMVFSIQAWRCLITVGQKRPNVLLHDFTSLPPLL